MKKLSTACTMVVSLMLAWGTALAAEPTYKFNYGVDGDDLQVENGNNMWVLDTDTGYAYHENLKRGSINDISIASFLEVWYDAVGLEPTTATLWATYGYGGCGTTTWRTGTGFDVRFVSYFDGLVISFENTAENEFGKVAYAIQGQNDETDWGGGHAQVRDFQIMQLGGVVITDTTVTPWYELIWDTTLDKSAGSIYEQGGVTKLGLGGTTNAAGFNITNCGPNSLVWPETSIRWIVDTLEIIDP